MDLNELIKRLLEIKAEYGNLPEIYVAVEFLEPGKDFMRELVDLQVEERRTLFLIAEEEIE
jgi:hypothetical protein